MSLEDRKFPKKKTNTNTNTQNPFYHFLEQILFSFSFLPNKLGWGAQPSATITILGPTHLIISILNHIIHFSHFYLSRSLCLPVSHSLSLSISFSLTRPYFSTHTFSRLRPAGFNRGDLACERIKITSKSRRLFIGFFWFIFIIEKSKYFLLFSYMLGLGSLWWATSRMVWSTKVGFFGYLGPAVSVEKIGLWVGFFWFEEFLVFVKLKEWGYICGEWMMDTGRLVAGSHNRNEFILINADENARVKSFKNLSFL